MSEQVNEGVSVEVTQAGAGGGALLSPGQLGAGSGCSALSPALPAGHTVPCQGFFWSLCPPVSPVAKLVQGPGWRLTGLGLLT